MNQLTDEMVESAIAKTGLTMAPLTACLNGYACLLGICAAADQPKEEWSNWSRKEMAEILGLDISYAYGVANGFDGNPPKAWSGLPEGDRASRVAGYEFGKRWRDKLGIVTPTYI